MARNRKLKKLKSPCYALLFYEEAYEGTAKEALAGLVKVCELHTTPDSLKHIPAEGDQKENTFWVNLVKS